MIKIIETPRDAIQGLSKIVPVKDKIKYINTLLKVGFDAVDVGSIVSSKAVPQMADTIDVIKGLDLKDSKSKIMVLVGNMTGAKQVIEMDEIDQIIYPFTVSQTFLKKNLNTDFKKAEKTIDDLLDLCRKHNKQAVIYLAMAFGNPYKDPWNIEIIHEWVEKLIISGADIIPLSDITGEATPEKIEMVFNSLIPQYPDIEFGFHLHTSSDDWYEKIEAAHHSGCNRFDTVTGGFGGCPMTGYELLSNLDTRNFLEFLKEEEIDININSDALLKAHNLAIKLFS